MAMSSPSTVLVTGAASGIGGRLAELLAEAEKREARRVKTKPSKAAKARRVDEKKGRAAVKAGRARVRPD